MAATAGIVGAAVAAFWFLTAAAPLDPAAVPAHDANLENGETLFHVGGCLGCHRPPAESGFDPRLPSGGTAFSTPIGAFYPQNLTPDPETGLGRWTAAEFVNAMRFGVSRTGTHYFPAFPYTSYRAMTTEDLLDLRAWLMNLPAVKSPSRDPNIPLPAFARRAIGLWKRIAFRQAPHSPDASRSAAWKRGAYLTNAPGHCGECHTPKNQLMVADEERHFLGGPHPGEDGTVPSLRGLVARGKYKDAADLTLALQNGETLGYENLSSGGMAVIQEQLARLPEAELRAISQYLVSLD